MNKVEQLYRQVIMNHYKYPQHKGLVDDVSYVSFHIKNPSCGDDITVQSKIENGIIKDIKHDGSGCSICCSSASIMATTLIGKTVEDAQTTSKTYLDMIMNRPHDEVDLGDAQVFEGIREFPARQKCATIAWNAFLNTIQGSD
jgi:SUF system NifU family Fe-S assembly protein